MPKKDEDWGKVQERMTRAIISELRDDLEDLLRGLKAGTLDYITALKHLKILLQEDLNNPLVGAVDVKYRKAACGASIWVRRRRRSEWMAAADSERRIVAIRSAGKQFLIVARAAR